DGRHGDLLRRGCLPARRLTAAKLTPELACASSTPRGADACSHSSTSTGRLAASGDEYESTNGDPPGSGHPDDPPQSELQLGIDCRILRLSKWCGGSLPAQRSGSFDPGVQRSRKVDCSGHEPGERFQFPGGDGLLPQAQASDQSSRDKLQPVDQPQVSTGDRSQDDATSQAVDGLDLKRMPL